MKEVMTLTWCDVHQAAGERVEATVLRVIALDGNAERELDMCDECDEKVFAPIEKLLNLARPTEASLVRRPPKNSNGAVKHKSPSQLPATCPFCGQEYSGKKITTDHMWSAHAGRGRPAQPEVCPDCNERIEVPQAMTRHRTVQHGYDSWEEALEAVRAARKASRTRR